MNLRDDWHIWLANARIQLIGGAAILAVLVLVSLIGDWWERRRK